MSTLLISTTSLATGVKGTAYSATVAASGGTAPYTWSVLSGSLPTGLTLASSTGVISGTPSATGSFSFTLEAADAASDSATAEFTIAVQTAYTGSKASVAQGTITSIGPLVSSTQSPTYTAIAEIQQVAWSGAKTTVLATTNLSSVAAEKLNGLPDFGQLKLTMNRITNDPGQMALAAAFSNPGKYYFQVQEPVDPEIGQTTQGNLYQFQAIVSEGPTFDLETNKVTVLSYTLEISGAPAFTAGS
jgi:hypothetical protein